MLGLGGATLFDEHCTCLLMMPFQYNDHVVVVVVPSSMP